MSRRCFLPLRTESSQRYHEDVIIPGAHQPSGGCLAGGRIAWRRSLTGRFISWLEPHVAAWRRGGAGLQNRPREAGRKTRHCRLAAAARAASQGESPVRDEIGIASGGRLEGGCQRRQSVKRLRAGLFGESVASSNVSAGRARRLHRGQGLARQALPQFQDSHPWKVPTPVHRRFSRRLNLPNRHPSSMEDCVYGVAGTVRCGGRGFRDSRAKHL
jgi:hypothetical protein